MNSVYQYKVELLLRLMPLVMEEKVFAVHGGTAINLFVKNMPRYSVDIDLTYIPLAGREESLQDINTHLKSIVDNAARRFK
ncbi:MAG: nucleotidyl transferase AbiEii/AbiGii toxin family protein, partial [Bacteroidales bacterium]|nr:nucleotidyl transferase AbiEii/AbiGii toxin family protein [Bacteroidales bacterium]